KYGGKEYTIIEVDGGDLSGNRQANVAVDIGFGDREYWALTNEYGQLVTVIADKIILQDEKNEPVKSNGRYYYDEAKVPGVERKDLDEGHVIADSLGGVSNAYNITPQDSTLNRHGDQAYMEKVIRDAGGCQNFIATITYPDTKTQIPSRYKYEYTLKGRRIVDEFANGNPEKQNDSTQKKEEIVPQMNPQKKPDVKPETMPEKPESEPEIIPEKVEETNSTFDEKKELQKIDKNGNGKVTIKEAKDAGYTMPIYKDHWLYKYMDDRDGDGIVGE
ncbi:MAG: DNA/RNA non-specific endonuclease, partial [Clostridiales bacterium]|nr:DNA/RNA non-specific endonuclease [Clostridiales bacterium]